MLKLTDKQLTVALGTAIFAAAALLSSFKDSAEQDVTLAGGHIVVPGAEAAVMYEACNGPINDVAVDCARTIGDWAETNLPHLDPDSFMVAQMILIDEFGRNATSEVSVEYGGVSASNGSSDDPGNVSPSNDPGDNGSSKSSTGFDRCALC
ncbi:MAG: hypothetical protein AAF244_02095 [Pseudomonadota bacterium]